MRSFSSSSPIGRKPVASSPKNKQKEQTGPVVDHKGKGKEKCHSSAFDLLPREIIQEILYTADPNTFDSLTLINSRWHHASRNARLYSHQLTHCGIANVPEDMGDDETLPTLIRLFNEAGRRELFETVLHPEVTEVQLVCSASSSAAAFPGGEAFRFEFSPKGTHLLALLSSRIFVLDLSRRKIEVSRELKISRRPVSAAILDDGSILAVLSSNHHVVLYDLTGAKAKILRSFALDNEPRTIALSPGAEVLGAAYDGGIEVYSLHPGAGPTDRRAVNCDTVDSLAFSPDGTILLGTTLNPKSPTTVIVSAQHFSTDMPVEGLAQLWTTQVLFPRSSRDSSHASLLPGDEDEEGATWTFTYDRVYSTFRAVRVGDLRNGHTYFAGPSDENMGVIPPGTLPSSTKDGSLVAAGFGGGRVWVYGIPGKLDLPADYSGDSSGSIASTPERSNSNASRRERCQQLGSIVVPQWQVLCEKMRNVFIRGREVGQVGGLSGVKFVMSEDGSERLVAVAGGGVDDTLGECGEEEVFAIGGGRVVIYEFVRGPRVGSKTMVSMEIGDGIQGPVETLEEEHRDIEVEVDIVRRRTVAFRRNAANRQSTFPLGPGELSNIMDSEHPTPRTTRRTTMPISANETAATQDRPVSPLYMGGDQGTSYTFDDPYIQDAPRSRNTLHRAATVARSVPQTADSSRYARAVGPDGQPPPSRRTQPGPSGEDMRWSPPPPPYSPRSDNPCPLPVQLIWSLQGPPRHPEVHLPAPLERPSTATTPEREQSVALERTRSTVGNVLRRGSLFRITTSNISSPRSAPASPAISTSRDSTFSPNSHYATSSTSSLRRGSAGDILTHHGAIPPTPQIPVEHYAPATHAPPVRSSSPRLQLPVVAPSPCTISPRRQSVRRASTLRETYYAPQSAGQQLSPPRVSSPHNVSPASSAIVRRVSSASVVRRQSRAGRSAQINVREARKRRDEKKAGAKKAARGGKASCVVM